ncbi:MAG TPA: FAD binding domain-containing protein, partial [Reyranella sp.]|nr:FAD binding domain-containing protein [Reyranella sp.]
MPCTMRWRRWASSTWKCPPPRSTYGNRSKAPSTRPPSNRRKIEMYDFAYHRPKSLADAVSLLKGKPEGRVMSGGMTLIPTLKQRLAKPSDVVDL